MVPNVPWYDYSEMPSTMNSKKIAALLERYLEQTTTAAENELVEKWLQDHGNTHSVWDNMDPASKEKWLTKRFAAINHAIDHPRIVKRMPIIQKRLAWISGIAAASIVLVLMLYTTLPLLKPAALTVRVATNAQKKLLVLADGSRVWLNHNSALKYPKSFNGNTREVYLTGEAYFDVQHDAKKTFIIHNGKFSTTVLGTAFNIKEDQNSHTIQVTVSRGKVSVANAGKTLAFLLPNQQLSFNVPKQLAQQGTVNAEQVSLWKREDLHFEDVTFGEAIAQLSLHFGVNISLSNQKLENCRFTGTNLAQQQLEDIIKVMCAFNNASYAQNKDGSFVISGQGCN